MNSEVEVCGGGGLVAKSCPTLAILWTVACQAPLSMGFSRQEYWSGLPFPSPGHLPYPGIEPGSPALQADDLPTEQWSGSMLSHCNCVRLCATPSLGFSRQEHWSGLPFPSPMHKSGKWKWSHSVMSDSSRPHGLQPTRLLYPWDFPGKSTGVGCHCLLQGGSIVSSYLQLLTLKCLLGKCRYSWHFTRTGIVYLSVNMCIPSFSSV